MPKSSKKSVKRKLGEPTVLETDAKVANTETEHVDSGATGSEGAAAHHEQEEVGEGTENNAGPGHYMTKVLPSNNEGKGWKESAADITLRGLGWVSIVGAGTASINVRVPKGVGVDVRPPLMPFDHWQYTGKFTGGRAINRTGYTKGKKKTKRAVVPRSK